MMDCFRLARKEVGTAPFPKAKQDQKLKIEAYNQKENLESEIDLSKTDDQESDESQDTEESAESPDDHETDEAEDDQESEKLQEDSSDQESEEEEEVSTEKNWWDNYGSDNK